MERKLSHADLLQLKRWNTPTIYNGWEQITRHNSARDAFNLEPVTDYMPQIEPMVGYAVTVVIEPSSPDHPMANPEVWEERGIFLKPHSPNNRLKRRRSMSVFPVMLKSL